MTVTFWMALWGTLVGRARRWSSRAMLISILRHGPRPPAQPDIPFKNMRLTGSLVLAILVLTNLHNTLASSAAGDFLSSPIHPVVRFEPSTKARCGLRLNFILICPSDFPVSQLTDNAAPPAQDDYDGSVYAMYTGILVLFGIMWTIYFFLYAWQYDSIGNYSFFVSSYIVS